MAAVVLVATRSRRQAEQLRPDARDLVVAAASRAGCPPEQVAVRETRDEAGPLLAFTIHCSRSEAAERVSLELQAAAHNEGERLEPGRLNEAGGYGLGRLDGRLGGERVRIVLLGQPPEPTAPPVKVRATRAPERTGAPRLAIVLDDAGHAFSVVRELAPLPKQIAVAILPNSPAAERVAHGLAAQGRELLLHMPMEPLSGSAGEGAVVAGLAPAEVEGRVRAALVRVPGVRGVNNHMGSRATADAALMRGVMSALAGREVYFLDSRTTAETVAETTARESGVAALRRDVFLDVVDEPDEIRKALGQAIAKARANGSAVAIGHVHPITIAVLEQELPAALGDVVLVPPSSLATR